MKEELGDCSYLVVDDDAFACVAIVNVLENIGCSKVFSTCDCEDACSIATKKQPDFVLIDIHMPGTDGWTVLKRLRKVSPNSVFLMVSSSTQLADLNASVELRADGYVIKPVLPYSFPGILNKARSKTMKRQRL